MKHRIMRWKNLGNIAPGCIIIIVGFFLFTFRLTHESVWCDESFTWAMTNHSFNKIIQYTIDFENHPPLFYLLLKAFRLLGGNSILSIRLFSVLGALALAALGLGPIRRACGQKTGLLFSGLVILTPGIVSMAQNGRMYTWSAFFVIGTVLYAYHAATGGKLNDWVKLGVFTLGAAYMHYYALLGVALSNTLLFIWLVQKERRRLLPYLITMSAVFIVYLPWLLAFIKQTMEVRQNFWIPPLSLQLIGRTLAFPFGDKFYSSPELFIFRPYAFGLTFTLILWGLWRTKAVKAGEHLLNLYSITVYFLTFLSGFLISYLFRPIWVERYITTVLGLFILSLAMGLTWIKRKSVFIIICALILVVTLPGIYQIYQQRFNGPMREVASYLEPQLPADAVFVHFDWVTRDMFYYYFPHHMHYVYMPSMNKNYPPDPVLSKQSRAGSDLNEFLQGKNDIRFVIKLGFPGEDNANAIIASKNIKGISPPKIFRLPYSRIGILLVKGTIRQP